MSRLAVSIGCLLLAGTALPDSNAADGTEPDRLETIELPAGVGRLELRNTRIVSISALDTGLECQRTVPTGSRIARQACYTREENYASEIARQMAQRNVDELRDIQMYRELARAEARRRAFTEMGTR